MAEQAVIVKFDYSAPNLTALHALEDLLSEYLANAAAGVCDGHDITPDLKKGTIYLYGRAAEDLFLVAQSVFMGAECAQNAVATLRFGPPEDGVRERIVPIPRYTGPNLRPW